MLLVSSNVEDDDAVKVFKSTIEVEICAPARVAVALVTVTAPVTPRVLLNVAAPVTPSVLLKVAAPVTPSVLLSVTAPVTPNVPAIVVFSAQAVVLDVEVPIEVPPAARPRVPTEDRYMPLVVSLLKPTPGVPAFPLANLSAPVIGVWPSADMLPVSAVAISLRSELTAVELITVFGENGDCGNV